MLTISDVHLIHFYFNPEAFREVVVYDHDLEKLDEFVLVNNALQNTKWFF
jgi:hypothetical protein